MPTDHVARLIEKASQDAYVLERLLSDPKAPIEVFGFHAQQAVEKLLKAALANAKIAYPRTHRLIELIDILKAHGILAPSFCEELRELTPFAVDFRYDVTPSEDDKLDKEIIYAQIRKLREWVCSITGPTSES